MPSLGWAFVAILIAIAMPVIGQIVAVLVMFVLAVPASAIFLPILKGISAIGFDGPTTQTTSYAATTAVAVVVAIVLSLWRNRLPVYDDRRKTLANALAVVVGAPICIGAAYYRARGLF